MMKTSMREFGVSKRVGHDSSPFYKRNLFDNPKRVAYIAETQHSLSLDLINKIYNHSSENMEQLPDNSVHLMITSPPYNVGKDYDDDLSLKEYKNLIRTVMRETFRVLVDGGRACINIANVGRKPYIPFNGMFSEIMIDLGYLMRGEIIWNKGASAGTSCAWGSWRSASNPTLRDVHEYILIFSKGNYARKKNEQFCLNHRQRRLFRVYKKHVELFQLNRLKRSVTLLHFL